MLLTFEIPGIPVPKQSFRAAVVNGHVKGYQPRRVKDYEAWVSACAVTHRLERPIDEPVDVSIEAVFVRPERMSKYHKRTGELLYKRGAGRQPCDVKPDCEQISKPILDAMQNCGVLLNDSRVVRLTVEKEYAAIGEQPHARVTVWRHE